MVSESAFIDLTGTWDVGVYVDNYDRANIKSNKVDLTYVWNEPYNTQVVTFYI